MPQSHRKIYHWDQWLTHYPGQCLLAAEQQSLQKMLETQYGKHSILIGVPRQLPLLTASVTPYQGLVTPLPTKHRQESIIEGEYYELPLLSASVDLVILPHILELVDNPRQLLAEACRVVKPEGCLAICSFNPYSLWGLRRLLLREKTTPWNNHLINASTVMKWLRLADFEIMQQTHLLFRPPIFKPSIYEKMQRLERIGKFLYPKLGSVYIFLARAKVIPLTPIRLRWQQQLSGIRISASMSGRIVRSAE